MFSEIVLNSIKDERGTLLAIESAIDIPFEIKRVYCLSANTNQAVRGRHAHKNLQQVIVCLQGQFKLLIDDGLKRSKFVMKTGDPSILINSLVWRELSDFSDDAVVLVLASEHYDEADYIRDYEHFLRAVK